MLSIMDDAADGDAKFCGKGVETKLHMSSKQILAIDAGTTGIRTILFDQSSRVRSKRYREFSQITPAPGLLEHDPTEIWETTA